MKILSACFLMLLSPMLSATAQGTLIYDQKSTDAAPLDEGGVLSAYSSLLFAQSFTPALSSVGFVRLAFFGIQSQFSATMYVNLSSESIGGNLLASSDPVFIPVGWAQGYNGITNFFFSEPVTVNPGQTYFLQLGVASTGDYAAYIAAGDYNYPGGEEFENGNPLPNSDLWFQEGTYVVPEPSCWRLIFLSSGILFAFWACNKRTNGTSQANHSTRGAS